MIESLFMAIEQTFGFGCYLDRTYARLQIRILPEHSPLAFGQRKIGKAYTQRNYLANIETIKTKIVSEKMSAEMPPTVSEQFVQLGG